MGKYLCTPDRRQAPGDRGHPDRFSFGCSWQSPSRHSWSSTSPFFLPTPCYQLRVDSSGPDEQNRIQLKAYGVGEKEKACNLMALATRTRVGLNLGSLPKGHYPILLNGKQIGEMDT